MLRGYDVKSVGAAHTCTTWQMSTWTAGYIYCSTLAEHPDVCVFARVSMLRDNVIVNYGGTHLGGLLLWIFSWTRQHLFQSTLWKQEKTWLSIGEWMYGYFCRRQLLLIVQRMKSTLCHVQPCLKEARYMCTKHEFMTLTLSLPVCWVQLAPVWLPMKHKPNTSIFLN